MTGAAGERSRYDACQEMKVLYLIKGGKGRGRGALREGVNRPEKGRKKTPFSGEAGMPGDKQMESSGMTTVNGKKEAWLREEESKKKKESFQV